MTQYNVFYKDLQIGCLEINDTGQYRYTPIDEAISSIEEKVSLNYCLKNTYDWGNPIPFFSERIRNASRFNLKRIQYHTDYFIMEEVENE